MLSNAVCSLIAHDKITTTLVKAKEIRRLADRMVTYGKIGTLHTRRLAIATLHQVDIVAKLFSDTAKRFTERNGGYTRIIKLGPRRGDGAELAILQFVESDEETAARKKAEDAAKAEANAKAAAEAEAEAPTAEVEAPKEESEAPKEEAPAAETPEAEAPKEEASEAEAPKADN